MLSTPIFAPGDKVIRYRLSRRTSRVRGTVLRANLYAGMVTVRELIRTPGQRIIWDVPVHLLDDLASSTL